MSTNFGGNFPAVRKVNQRDKLMFLAVVGLVVSLVLLIFLFNSKSKATASAKREEKKQQAVPAAVGTITLFAANKRIPSGSKLADFKFKPVYWPRNSVPEGSVRDLAELRGMFAKSDIESGIPIQRTHLTDQVAYETLAITPGMRAVTIPIDEKSGIEGWAQPGARVDVVLTYQDQGELKSKVIVENARVLSLGGDSRTQDERIENRKQAVAQRTITLEVGPSDALKVQTSLQLGKLALIMRSKEDDRALAVTEVGQNQIDGNSRADSARQRTCNNGKMRVGGKEYLIDCDGSLTQLVNPNEP